MGLFTLMRLGFSEMGYTIIETISNVLFHMLHVLFERIKKIGKGELLLHLTVNLMHNSYVECLVTLSSLDFRRGHFTEFAYIFRPLHCKDITQKYWTTRYM